MKSEKQDNTLDLDQIQFNAVLDEASRLRFRKLQDYGQSYKNFGPLGVAVRLADKIARISNLLQKGGRPNNESLRDSAIDAINYSAMLVMLLDEEGPLPPSDSDLGVDLFPEKEKV